MSPTKSLSRFLIMLLLIPLASCIKSEDFDFNKLAELEWNPTLAVPLVSSELSMMDMIKQTGDSSNFVIDNQGFVTLVYKDRLFSINPMADFKIPSSNTTYSRNFSPAESLLLESGNLPPITIPLEIKITPADTVRIDSLIYAKGILALTASGTVTNSGSISIEIPEAKKGTSTLKLGLNSFNSSQSLDLSGYKFDLTKVSGKESTILVNVTITLNKTPNVLISGKTLSINITQNTESIKSVAGYLGRFYLLNEKKTEIINLFNNAFSVGKFALVNPYFIFTFQNSIGLPVSMNFAEITGKSNIDGSSLNIAGKPGIPSNFTIGVPTYLEPIKTTQLRIEGVDAGKEISNLLNTLKLGTLTYNINSLTNPDGKTPNGIPAVNFLRDDSKLDIDVEFGLPLNGLVENFAIQDTFDFKFDNIEDVESLLLRTIFDNGFPLEAKMQVTFTDANFTPLDVLVTGDPIIIPAAQVSQGKVTIPTSKTTDFTYNKARIKKITGAEKILVKAILNTTGASTGTNIKIYDTYKMKVRLAAQAEIKQKI